MTVSACMTWWGPGILDFGGDNACSYYQRLYEVIGDAYSFCGFDTTEYLAEVFAKVVRPCSYLEMP